MYHEVIQAFQSQVLISSNRKYTPSFANTIHC
jgi:hypothetical protein